MNLTHVHTNLTQSDFLNEEITQSRGRNNKRVESTDYCNLCMLPFKLFLQLTKEKETERKKYIYQIEVAGGVERAAAGSGGGSVPSKQMSVDRSSQGEVIYGIGFGICLPESRQSRPEGRGDLFFRT